MKRNVHNRFLKDVSDFIFAGVRAWLGTVIIGALLTLSLHAQSERFPAILPKFDVVSVNPNHSGELFSSGSPIIDKVGRYSAKNVTLKTLISWFYGVFEFQIAGGPKWLDADRYDIEAKVDGQPAREQSIGMLQALLADRFQLKMHSEQRDVSGYALVAKRAGLRFGAHLSKVERPECAVGPPGASGCQGVIAGPQSVSMEDVTSVELVRTLSSMMRFVVIDDTGLDGRYDVKLDLMPPAAGAVGSYADTLMNALQEQTGLRVEPRKVPAQLLVVDRAEKATDN